jgi:hypothetical protein
MAPILTTGDRVAEEELGQNLLQQAFDLWIHPEIERRQTAGQLPDDFVLRGAQVIMNLDADAPEARLNEEVRAVAHARAARPIEKGEPLTEADLQGIEDIVLTDQDPNAGHLAMVLLGDRWISHSISGTTPTVLPDPPRRRENSWTVPPLH